MKRKLKEELVKMATEILTSQEDKNISQLYENAKNLYEKLAVLKFIEEKLDDIQIDVSKNVLASKFETLANAVMTENRSVPENNPHEEDIITPGIDTIKHMISEMPSAAEVEQVFREFVAKKEVIKEDKEILSPVPENDNPPAKSLNEKLVAREIKVDLNDRLAFVKHLFRESTEDFNRVISQLNTIDSEERSRAFIENLIKPEYDNWKGKENYENRFMALIERRFS
ncbi:hypothetical protein [Lentiprolixibacter aurantiacus]|uniref:Uncharacterized protein n=1 Tax=Lentiprolixibacter aurantiacus TaxID=2993939 RepID=A0AAE3MJ67_9FLAO|nr:hypothetical protein [Lentiprolixibacter aurantiacus]MCX2718408.1 hypothetical protein [Lentiprolixibacter aurantiacus]